MYICMYRCTYISASTSTNANAYTNRATRPRLTVQQYSDATATTLARHLLSGATSSSRIAVVSAPSVFIQIKNLLATGEYGSPQVTLLEYDSRFGVFKEFVPYDFEAPMKLPTELKGAFDRIICDPPFLSEDCQTKGKFHFSLEAQERGEEQRGG